MTGVIKWGRSDPFVFPEDDRVITSPNSSRIGGNSEGHITGITRNREETTTWRRLMPGTNSWTSGINITENSFMSSDIGSNKSESLNFPMEGGGTLS